MSAGNDHSFTVDGRHHHVEQHGDAGPWLTLLHGGLVDSRSWGAFRDLLAEDLSVLSFDLAGYGRSTPTPDRHPLTGGAEDCVAVWEHLRIERSWVLGFSQGGFAALRVLQRAPHRVLGVVLESTAASLPSDVRASFAARAERIHHNGVGEGVLDHAERAFAPGFAAREPAVHGDYLRMVASADPTTVAATFEALAEADESASLAEIAVPCLVVAGDADPTFGNLARELAAAIPGEAGVHIVQGAGHTLHLEQPGEMAALVKTFIFERPDALTSATPSTSTTEQGE
jgi:3-oxoadipate enol-lactonase